MPLLSCGKSVINRLLLQLFIHIFLYIGRIHIFFHMPSVHDHKCRCLHDPKLSGHLRILFCIDNLKFLSLKHLLCHLTVWTGACCKKILVLSHRLDLYIILSHCNHTCMNRLHFFDIRMHDIIKCTVLILLSLAIIPVLYRSVISCDTAVNLRLLATFRTGEVLTAYITMFLTYRICRRNGVIRQFIILCDLAHQGCRRLPVRKLLTDKCMEYST